MKPLRDTEPSSPLLRQARALLESEGPLPDSRERMLRVRRALDEKQRAGALRKLPALLVAGLVALFGASAFAAVRYVAERSAAQERAAEQARAGRKPARQARALPAVTEPVEADRTAQAAAVEVAQAVAVEDVAPASTGDGESAGERASVGSRSRVKHRARASAARGSRALGPREGAAAASSAATAPQAVNGSTAVPATGSAPAPAAAASKPAAVDEERNEQASEPNEQPTAREREPQVAEIEDSALVHRALQALRRQHDPELASRLLAQHRARRPTGPLAEEALSLQIEAALQLEDPRALMFAREYLAHYPHGRYVRVARKALAGGR